MSAVQLMTSRLLSAPLLDCIAEVDRWMSSNRVKLDADMTEFIWL
jgi:hypothetical protein